VGGSDAHTLASLGLTYTEVPGAANVRDFLRGLRRGQGRVHGASGDYLKQAFPSSKIAAGEALQCPTLLSNGYGAHRIEGIGDKHVPWIHNVRNTDLVIAVDDNDPMNLLRLFNEPAGRDCLVSEVGLKEELVSNLDILGISSIANVLMAIKFAKYYELNRDDVVVTVFTDSMELYQSRLREAREQRGEYRKQNAATDYARLMAMKTDSMIELTQLERKRIHNLKYFTWIEQQKVNLDELNRQWYDHERYFSEIQNLSVRIDWLIKDFNAKVDLL
jgi:hypothetical protein